MKRIVLVGRQDIFDPQTMTVHDDMGLRALDGILFGQVRSIEDNVDPLSVWQDMKREFEQEHPNFHADRYAIRLTN